MSTHVSPTAQQELEWLEGLTADTAHTQQTQQRLARIMIDFAAHRLEMDNRKLWETLASHEQFGPRWLVSSPPQVVAVLELMPLVPQARLEQARAGALLPALYADPHLAWEAFQMWATTPAALVSGVWEYCAAEVRRHMDQDFLGRLCPKGTNLKLEDLADLSDAELGLVAGRQLWAAVMGTEPMLVRRTGHWENSSADRLRSRWAKRWPELTSALLLEWVSDTALSRSATAWLERKCTDNGVPWTPELTAWAYAAVAPLGTVELAFDALADLYSRQQAVVSPDSEPVALTAAPGRAGIGRRLA